VHVISERTLRSQKIAIGAIPDPRPVHIVRGSSIVQEQGNSEDRLSNRPSLSTDAATTHQQTVFPQDPTV
jgi:hypothetical protein